MAYKKVIVDNVIILDISDTTATEADVATGKKFYKANGQPAYGSFTSNFSDEEFNALNEEFNAAKADIVAIWNGLSKQSTTIDDYRQDLTNLLTWFGIDYNEKDESSYSSSNEYEP